MASAILSDLNQNLPSNRVFCIVYDSWLSECREYISKNKGTTTEFDQWLLHDLNEISPGYSPLKLKNKKNKEKNKINERKEKKTYAFQINRILNFDKASIQGSGINLNGLYKNIKRVTKADQHDLKNKGLILIMTDGLHIVIGCVLETIKDLYINTVPGCKILVKDPVHFLHKGFRFLLLNDGNCELLGGEVKALMEKNYDHTKNQIKNLNLQRQSVGLPVVSPQSNERYATINKKRCNNNSDMPVIKRIKTESAGKNYNGSNLEIAIDLTSED